MKHSELKQLLIDRDNYTPEEAQDLIDQCSARVYAGEDPQDAMQDLLGVEPDYIFDII